VAADLSSTWEEDQKNRGGGGPLRKSTQEKIASKPSPADRNKEKKGGQGKEVKKKKVTGEPKRKWSSSTPKVTDRR